MGTTASTLGAGVADRARQRGAALGRTLIAAGDDPGDLALVGAAVGVRRGARVVVVAPRGPLRTARRSRRAGNRGCGFDEFGPFRYPAAGSGLLVRGSQAAHRSSVAGRRAGCGKPATAPVERCSPQPAAHFAALSGCQLALRHAATLALARHGSSASWWIAKPGCGYQAFGCVAVALCRIAAMLFHDDRWPAPQCRAGAAPRRGRW